ncbi:FtsB family cell division protein [Algibacter lectus]|uniref:Cell division protein DivIC n=1 Tax=Algibacter lectus TaxID=221126 RepID=A0A090VM75_9FLAO|nr:septum formation initiator family protein [Algibacter lectus]MWW25894.1 septum formation initiator [Algibacter lectus]TDY60620.1 cell division protein FtsB [Algibacter lectus]SFD29598.1 Cell division protein FtsB [Algibacter lectus]GAL64399.1 cell division protein DivIC [Algibacter lectus]GAL79850.1 cell division protein DivIC [Algibacter lectus]
MAKFNKNTSKYLKPFKNWFILIFTGFLIWMIFFDANSWVIHHELNSDIEALENEKEYYQREIENDNKAIKKLSSEDGLEKFAREEYFMKRENEDIYIIEYEDSLKVKQDD